ncbi:MAG TPA: substrate-binding domain-containing protein, partial [Bacillota bacterium]|nr:substrate-binding domain-containing protein [Bacillota bacterium]
CIEGINAAGLSIPDDISVAGYDGILFSQIMTPRLTTMKQDTAKIGEHAARLLIYNIEHAGRQDTSPVVIKSELIKGESVRRI